MPPTHNMKNCRDWTQAEREDVAEVTQTTERDDTGITYAVCVALRSLAAHAYEEGENRLRIWTKRVDFGSTDSHCAGGYAFTDAARTQARLSDEIADVVWGYPQNVSEELK